MDFKTISLFLLTIVALFSVGALAVDDSQLQKSNDAAELSNQASALLAKAVQLEHAQKYDEAKVIYEQALVLKPMPPYESAEIRTGLGIVLEHTGHSDEARAQYKIALDYDPQNREAIFNMACCCENIGDLEQAKKYFTKYVNDFPNDPNRNSVLATLHSLQQEKSFVNENKDTTDYFKNVIANGIELWPKKSMPIKVFIPEEEHVPGFQKSFTEILSSSFDEWAKVASRYFSWKSVSNEHEADIVCSWTDNPKDLKYQGAEAGESSCDYIPMKNGERLIVYGRIKLCLVDPLSGTGLSDEKMTSLCLHEIGHALGLRGHSPNNNDIMFFSIDNVHPACKLSTRDVATINRLYETYQAKLEAP